MIGADSLGYMQTDYLEGMAGACPYVRHASMEIIRWRFRIIQMRSLQIL